MGASQALFESDGRAFVYLQTPNGFMPHDVKLVQRSESQVVLTGVQRRRRGGAVESRPATRAANGRSQDGADEGALQMILLYPDLGQAFGNLRAQKTRTLLTALGIVFGVGSVIGMLAIGAGRARGIAALHRATGRAQHPDRFAPGHEPGGIPAAPARRRRG